MRLLKLLRSSIFVLIFFLTTSAYATHIVGGELYYDCLGGNQYKITLKLYRDCLPGHAPYDNYAHISFFNAAGTLLFVDSIAFPGSVVLPLISIDPCLNPPMNICVEQAIYVKNFTLPPIPGGYTFAYQRCCRNVSINNLIDPWSTGATYSNSILDTSIVKCNNSPRFKNFPPIFICQNVALQFDHSAIDPDGDSISYELCTPFDGATFDDPMPIVTSPPPFSPVTFLPPYSSNDPLGGIPLAIDPVTGVLTGTPNTLGQFVVGVCVKEFRNGVLLNTHKRDFQFNVAQCPPKNSASLPVNIISCGYTLTFQNFSTGAFKYFWDFGVTTLTNDTSLAVQPTYTYPGIGIYTVMLITNKGEICVDTAYAMVNVYDVIQGANFSLQNVCVNAVAQFTDLSVLSEGHPVAWDWNFKDGSSINHLQNPTHIFVKPTVYNIFFRVYNEKGCTDTLTKPITIYPLPTADAGRDTIVCPGISAPLYASGGVSYLWRNSSLLSCTACQNTIASPPQNTTNYFMVEVTSAYNCKASDSAKVVVRPFLIPKVSFTGGGRCVNYAVPFTAAAENFDFLCTGPIIWNWNFGDGQVSNLRNPVHLFPKEGNYVVSLGIQNAALFKDTITLLSPDSCLKNIFVPNAFTPNGDGENDFAFLRTINAVKVNFRIYNRWGEEVFHTESLHEGWDGSYKGVKQTPQSFVFVADVVFYDGTEKTLKGNITLIE
jgi:gliding motility-associated-like protein